MFDYFPPFRISKQIYTTSYVAHLILLALGRCRGYGGDCNLLSTTILRITFRPLYRVDYLASV
jgi:hypothetical protein